MDATEKEIVCPCLKCEKADDEGNNLTCNYRCVAFYGSMGMRALQVMRVELCGVTVTPADEPKETTSG